MIEYTRNSFGTNFACLLALVTFWEILKNYLAAPEKPRLLWVLPISAFFVYIVVASIPIKNENFRTGLAVVLVPNCLLFLEATSCLVNMGDFTIAYAWALYSYMQLAFIVALSRDPTLPSSYLVPFSAVSKEAAADTV